MSTITVTPGAVFTNSPPERPARIQRTKRVIIPSEKARETLKSRKSGPATRRATRDESPPRLSFRDIESTEDEEETETTIQALTELVKGLQNTITTQNELLKDAQTQLKEISEEQRTLKTQVSELQDEVRTLRGQVSSFSASLPSTQSWASVVASTRSSQPTSQSATVPLHPSHSEAATKERNCLRISTKGQKEGEAGGGSFTRYLTTDEANIHIRGALQKREATKEVGVAGIGTTKTGYVVRFKDQESMEKARASTEWLQELGNETKLVKPRFGVVAHRFPTMGISLPDNKQEIINKIMEENDWRITDFNIDDIAWLKQNDKELGVTASLGIWFDSAEAAQWAVANGVVCDQRYIGSVELYQVKRKRCHRCQSLGHLAWSCKEKMRCKHCGGEHDRKDCQPGADVKCADCGGPHNTGARVCPGPIVPRTSL